MNDIILFFNSNFFIALITVIVGLGAFLIYTKQKRDYKKDAANIILLEIKNAERVLMPLKESLVASELSENVFVMRYESWSKYKYLFVRDFDRDEWDSISDFYNKCQLLDECVNYQKSFFSANVEQIRANSQRILADFVYDHIKGNGESNETDALDKTIERFEKIFNERLYKLTYNPNKPLNDAKYYIGQMNVVISQTTIGVRLKRIAKIK